MLSKFAFTGFGILGRPVVTVTYYNGIPNYIVNGNRLQSGAAPTYNATFTAVDSNTSRVTVIKTTQTMQVGGIVLVRCPVDNWTTTAANLTLTISVVAGTIDGSSSGTKTYNSTAVSNNPATGRYSGADINDAVALAQYDLITMYAASPAVLTAGTYQISYRSTGQARDIAELYTAAIPVDTTNLFVYPDTSDASNTTAYPVMKILPKYP